MPCEPQVSCIWHSHPDNNTLFGALPAHVEEQRLAALKKRWLSENMHDHKDLGLGCMHDHACVLDHQLISSTFFLRDSNEQKKNELEQKKTSTFFRYI